MTAITLERVEMHIEWNIGLVGRILGIYMDLMIEGS